MTRLQQISKLLEEGDAHGLPRARILQFLPVKDSIPDEKYPFLPEDYVTRSVAQVSEGEPFSPLEMEAFLREIQLQSLNPTMIVYQTTPGKFIYTQSWDLEEMVERLLMTDSSTDKTTD